MNKKVLVFYRLPVLFVNETDNPAGNLPNCTKMPMTQNLADYAKFIFPTNQLVFLVIVITLVCSITPGIVYKFSSKQSVIDRLREINK